MKKNYTVPELKVVSIRSDERFAANCGSSYAPANPPHDKGCYVTWGEAIVVPQNS